MGKALCFLVSACLALGLAVTECQAKGEAKTTAVKRQSVKPVAKQRHRLARNVSDKPVFNADGDLVLRSSSVLVLDQSNGAVLLEKNAHTQIPIASITKLMTAMVVLDAEPDMQEELIIRTEDVDMVKGTKSRLRVGTRLTREEMLRLALMSSENRAAAALSRYYDGGRPAFVAAMNRKAAELGLTETRFEDPTGLTPANVSSARDLTALTAAAHAYQEIREFSTTARHDVNIGHRMLAFHNTNQLVGRDSWDIGLSKTGYISEAGRCLVMQAKLNNKPLIIVLLDSWGTLTRIADANRIRHWLSGYRVQVSGSSEAKPSPLQG